MQWADHQIEADKYMKIAIALENDRLCTHFGRCSQFAIMDVDTNEKRIIHKEQIDAPPHEPGLLPRWLAGKGANLVIAGGMGDRARQLLEAYGIEVITGATADLPERLVMHYLAGTLKITDNPLQPLKGRQK